MKKIFFIAVFFFVTSFAIAQKSINNYKYVLVPNKFEFLTKADKYQTSSLTKFLFNKYGFKAYLNTDPLPQDFNTNRCMALFADLEKTRSLFYTKINVILKDCNNVQVFKSKLGKSREKDFKKAYHEAIRNAFQSVDSLHYKYNPLLVKTTTTITSFNNKTSTTNNVVQLYAQPITEGYQLIDKTPTIVFVILKTSQPTLFLLKNKKGVVYKKDAFWVVEYYQDNQLVQRKIGIKF